MDHSIIFEKLKSKKALGKRSTAIVPIYFQIVFQNSVARLLVVDKEGVELTVDHRNYSGPTRAVLKTLELIRSQSKKEIKWCEKEAGINLSQNSFLTWQLKRCDNLVDESLNTLVFSDEPTSLIVYIEGEDQLECKFGLKINDASNPGAQLISETHSILNGGIYSFQPVGVDYATLKTFETLIFSSELEKYLSLLFSNCEDFELIHKDYTVVNAILKEAQPTLVIEKILPDNSLYLRISNCLPEHGPTFLDQFEIHKAATLNDENKTVEISSIHQTNLDTEISKVKRLLNELQKEDTEDSEYFEEDGLFIIDNPLSEIFLQRFLPELSHDYSIFGSEKLETYNLKVIKPDLKLSMNHGIDFFEGSAELLIDGQTFSFFEALHQIRDKSYLQLNDGSKAILDHEYISKLERIFQKRNEGVAISFFDLPLVEELIEDKIHQSNFSDFNSIYRGFFELKDKELTVPQSITAELRPYQVDGIKWLQYLNRNDLGGCLADDMGLGKTIQAITMLSFVYPTELKPSLIVIPKSLIFNWQNEVERFNPNLSTYLFYGNSRNLQSALKHQLIITTYGTLRATIEELKEIDFYYVILDESQVIKNHESQVSRAVILLKAEKRLALSGTPIENNLSELYSLFRFLNPAMFGSLASFNQKYLFPIQQGGNREIAQELKKKIYPFILRRLKKEVLQDLPEKVEQVLYVEMTEDQKRFYEQRRSFYFETIRNQIEAEGIKRSQFFVLQAITVLRQLASIPETRSEGQITSPKREVLLEMLTDAVSNNHKVLIFANFLGILEYLAEDLNNNGYDFETLTGATRNREIPVNRFQNDPNCKAFLMTLKAGGQGLNLTAADTVYIYDPWWNLAAENQAIDRSHRIGQDKTVFSYKFIAKGTIEERILLLQEKKRVLFENIVSNESMSFNHLDEEDIDYLIG